MVTVGLLIRIQAKPDKVPEVEVMLKSALEQVREDTATVVWFALRLGPATFGVFDASVDEAHRQAHLDAYGPHCARQPRSCSPGRPPSSTSTSSAPSCPLSDQTRHSMTRCHAAPRRRAESADTARRHFRNVTRRRRT